MTTTKRAVPTAKPRTRVVYFRISEEEFTRFCDLCEARGARNLSELARIALYSLIQHGGQAPNQDVSDRLTGLERSVLEVNERLRTLTQTEAGEPSLRTFGGKV
jgi:hypothetical protein